MTSGEDRIEKKVEEVLQAIDTDEVMWYLENKGSAAANMIIIDFQKWLQRNETEEVYQKANERLLSELDNKGFFKE